MNDTTAKPPICQPLLRLPAMLLAAIALAACAAGPSRQPGDYPPAMVHAPLPPASDGAVYQPATAIALFEDHKARRVGDTITVRLAERTQASKSASTDAQKNTRTETGAPTILGTNVTVGGRDILSNDWGSNQEFAGKGSSSQSNSLNGNITVTVAEVLPNGNLVVRGEKWLTLNQGEEYIQISGIVRPADIAVDNSVPSYKVADARITYSGNGVVPDANRPGAISRFFMKFWPL
jgi:flagellar L-ring protein precursor FlgH